MARRTAPAIGLALLEFPRVLMELSSLPAAAPILRRAPRGDGHAVLVLPGFATSDRSTGLLRRYLKRLGYDAVGWTLGRNLGPRTIGGEGERLTAMIETLHAKSGGKVSLVGQSLGGVMARELARNRPELIRQVICLGSPFAGDPRATNVSRLYVHLTGDRLDTETIRAHLARAPFPPPVPSTAVFSKSDGIVPWTSCVETESAQTDNIEIYGSHCGMAVHPAALFAVADRLAQPEDEWRRFDRSGWRAPFYPASSAARH